MRKVQLFITTVILSTVMGMTAFAGEWKQNSIGWWWQKDDGSYPASQWQWIDGNNDGISECYYFDTNGYMLFNTTTPDGYTVNSNGTWVLGGIIQTQSKSNDSNKSNESLYIQQEYLDAIGKNRDYVINCFGNTEKKVTSTIGSDILEKLYYIKETYEIDITLENNKVARIDYFKFENDDNEKLQQIVKKIDNQFGVKSEKTDLGGLIWYTWTINNNPSIEVVLFERGNFIVELETFQNPMAW